MPPIKPKLLFGCKIADEKAKERIEKFAYVQELEVCSEASLLEHIDGKVGLIVPYTSEVVVTREVLDAGSDLKLVGTTYGGTRQSIDDIYALEKALCVVHTGPTRARPMAEYTLGLVLSSLLEIHNYHHHMVSKDDSWPRSRYPRSRILHKRRVGVIGFGLIGRGICELFRHFTDDILVKSNHLSDDRAAELGVQRASISAIFGTCEIIILAGGHTDATTHLVGAPEFGLMQERALFVNIARGKMVDEAAMCATAKAKNIYLALDVFEEEPLADSSPLRELENVLLTPHRANNPIEFEQRWQFLADELERFFRGEKPQTALTLGRARVMSES